MQTAPLACYRCGTSLAALTLPLSRRDLCPGCSTELHVCRMCRHYDRRVPKQCREDDAEEVTHKDRTNFCDWFEPDPAAFDAAGKAQADAARTALDALFGDASPSPGAKPPTGPDDLFD